jgi:hypothetical protein
VSDNARAAEAEASLFTLAQQPGDDENVDQPDDLHADHRLEDIGDRNLQSR